MPCSAGISRRSIGRRIGCSRYLMMVQWLAAIVFALLVGPFTWAGAQSQVHVHVWAAVVLGGIISVVPAGIALASIRAKSSTRHIIAVAQMLMSALLIHLTGGRIETHFHVFGSLAILAFYRDWRVLVPATTVVAVDHMLRGLFWPQSVYGVLVASEWRWVEHAAWVIFEDVFLVIACVRGTRELREIAERTAVLEEANRDSARHAIEQGELIAASAPDAAAGRGRDAREERVRREHESRTAHAAQRDHAVQRAAAGRRGRRQADRRRRGSAQDSDGEHAPARADQRHSRSVEDRGRQDGAPSRDHRGASDGRGTPQHGRRGRAEQQQHADRHLRCRTSARCTPT